MKEITLYQCEICNEKYNTKVLAVNCESQGKFNRADYPIGLMFSDSMHGKFLGIFAIANVDTNMHKSHFGHLSYWAFRVNPYVPQTIGKYTCGGAGDIVSSSPEEVKGWAKRHHITEAKENSQQFNDMVTYLKASKITPRYYNAKGKLITLE